MNKKSQFASNFMKIVSVIIVFGIFIFLFLFFTVGFKQIMGENIIQPMVNTTLSGMNTSGVMMRSDAYTNIYDLQTEFDTQWFNYDLFFLVFFLTAFIGTIYSAAQLETPNFYSFWGVSTFGSMMFLLILTIVGNIRDWLILNFYTNLFNLSLVETPIIDWFVSNLQMISFVWFIILLLVAFLDWEGIFKGIDNSQGGFQQ